jgi:hypothetical protein
VQTVYRYWAGLVFLAVVVQVAFAGFGAFGVANDVADGKSVNEDRFDDLWGLHTGWGYLVLLFALVLLVIAAAARLGKRRVLHTVGLFGLVIVQILLAWFGEEVPAIGALHPLNAFLVLGASGSLAMAAWRGPGRFERMAGGA